MSENIAISLIEPNPFQSRKTIDKAAVARLAKEIGEVGFWNDTLRVRAHNGNYQLVVGHQRLEALKLLGHKKINAEVVELDDAQMAEQSLIENVQRDNLPEIDKAEAIARLVKLSSRDDKTNGPAVERIRLLLGYKSRDSIYDFLAMAGLEPATKQAVRKTNMGRQVASVARQFGGDRMVRRVAEVPNPETRRNLSGHDLEEMQRAVAPLPEAKREKIVEKVARGEVHTPAEVKRLARTEQSKLAAKKEIPPDLMVFIEKWTGDLRAWTRKLKAAGKHKAYIHEHPETASEFKDAAEDFIAELKELLDL